MDVVVLGGGVSNFDALYTKGVAKWRNRSSTVHWKRPLSNISSAIPPASSAPP